MGSEGTESVAVKGISTFCANVGHIIINPKNTRVIWRILAKVRLIFPEPQNKGQLKQSFSIFQFCTTKILKKEFDPRKLNGIVIHISMSFSYEDSTTPEGHSRQANDCNYLIKWHRISLNLNIF
jgi:hypothetical protein